MSDLFDDVETDDGTELEGRLSYDSRRINAAAVPAAFAAAFFINAIGLWVIPQIFYHEFGHAIAAWLAGRWALPIPVAGFTFWGGEHSWLAGALTFALIGWGIYWANAQKRNEPFVLLGLLFAFAVVFNFLMGPKECEAWMIWGGCAGEIFLPALVIVAFYWRLPDRWRWDFWRYPLLLSAACTFLHSATFWTSIRADPEHQMMGESLTKSRDSDADWVRLVHDHGWSAADIDESYLRLCEACGILMAASYLWGLRAAPASKKE